MADVYRMPAPKPPTDAELDELHELAQAALARIDVPAGVRQAVRLQAAMIRRLRLQTARAESQLRSVAAIAAIERDERVVEQAIAAQGECEGSGTAPFADLRSGIGGVITSGRCPVCRAMAPVDNAGMVEPHESPDPPLRSA